MEVTLKTVNKLVKHLVKTAQSSAPSPLSRAEVEKTVALALGCHNYHALAATLQREFDEGKAQKAAKKSEPGFSAPADFDQKPAGYVVVQDETNENVVGFAYRSLPELFELESLLVRCSAIGGWYDVAELDEVSQEELPLTTVDALRSGTLSVFRVRAVSDETSDDIILGCAAVTGNSDPEMGAEAITLLWHSGLDRGDFVPRVEKVCSLDLAPAASVSQPTPAQAESFAAEQVQAVTREDDEDDDPWTTISYIMAYHDLSDQEWDVASHLQKLQLAHEAGLRLPGAGYLMKKSDLHLLVLTQCSTNDPVAGEKGHRLAAFYGEILGVVLAWNAEEHSFNVAASDVTMELQYATVSALKALFDQPNKEYARLVGRFLSQHIVHLEGNYFESMGDLQQ